MRPLIIKTQAQPLLLSQKASYICPGHFQPRIDSRHYRIYRAIHLQYLTRDKSLQIFIQTPSIGKSIKTNINHGYPLKRSYSCVSGTTTHNLTTSTRKTHPRLSIMDKNNTLIDNRILSINNNSNNRFNEFSKRSFTCSAASLQNGGFDRSRSSTDAHRGSRSNSNTDADTHKGSRSNGNVSRSTEAQKPSPPRQMSVELTKREASIFRMLDRVAEDYEAMTGQRMHLRVAGGWVRDKLLGLESSDIDIGVDKMLGHEFAALVKEDMASRGVKTRPIVKIGSNPEKSKYLETAIMYIHGVHVDFANLRSDIYDDSSRYLNDPVFGTPYEDAHYRDFTINALFYNIRTNAIEDFTGRGLDDLKNGLIRTPLNAIETFWQDPLRVLRCLRFAGRFQFKIAGDATNAIMEPRIRQALRSKVSEERKGKEINKILEDDVARSTALRLLHELGLYDIIFPEPTISVLAKGTSHVHGHRGDVDNAFKLEWIMEWLLKINPMVTRSSIESSEFPFKAEQDLAQEQLLKQSQGLPITTHIYPIVRTENPSKEITEREMIEIKNGSVATLTTRRLLLGTLLFPFHKVIATTNEKTISGAAWVCKYCLKSTTRDILYVSTLQSNLGRVRRSVEANWDSERKEELEQGQQQEQEQEQEGQLSQGSAELASMGLLIKSIGASMPYGNEWPGAFLYGLGVELLPNFEQLKQGILDGDSKAKIAKYNTFFSKAEAYGLEHCYSWKSIISNQEFIELLNGHPGRRMRECMEMIMDWQLRNPHLSKEDCKKWILKEPAFQPEKEGKEKEKERGQEQ